MKSPLLSENKVLLVPQAKSPIIEILINEIKRIEPARQIRRLAAPVD
jgi:hypothetical protein